MSIECSKLQRIYGRIWFGRYADCVISHKNHEQKALLLENNIPYSWRLQSQLMVASVAIVNRILLRQNTKRLCYLLSHIYPFCFVNPVNLCYLVGKKTSYSPSPPKVGKKPTLPKPAPDVDMIYLITFQNSQKKEGDVNFVKWVTAMWFATFCLRKDQNCF